MAWKVSWVLSRLLTARKDVHTLGGKEGSARRSVMRPWASPITAMSTVILVPEDWDTKQRNSQISKGLHLKARGMNWGYRRVTFKTHFCFKLCQNLPCLCSWHTFFNARNFGGGRIHLKRLNTCTLIFKRQKISESLRKLHIHYSLWRAQHFNVYYWAISFWE